MIANLTSMIHAAFRAHAVEHYARKPLKGQKELHWVTIGGSPGERGEHEGGTAVQIDGEGNINAGPAALAAKGIKKLSDFGKKAASTPAAPSRPHHGIGPKGPSENKRPSWMKEPEKPKAAGQKALTPKEAESAQFNAPTPSEANTGKQWVGVVMRGRKPIQAGQQTDAGDYGKGQYFSGDGQRAAAYARPVLGTKGKDGQVHVEQVTLSNPLVFKTAKEAAQFRSQFASKSERRNPQDQEAAIRTHLGIMERGHDGVVVYDTAGSMTSLPDKPFEVVKLGDIDPQLLSKYPELQARYAELKKPKPSPASQGGSSAPSDQGQKPEVGVAEPAGVAKETVNDANWYGMDNRPPAMGAIPKGRYDHKPHPDFRHGQISFSRPLTEQEQYDYELTPIRGDAELPDVAKKAAAELGDYVGEYLKPDNAVDLAQRLNQPEMRRLIGHVDQGKLIAELRKQHGAKPVASKPVSEPDGKQAAKVMSEAEYIGPRQGIDPALHGRARGPGGSRSAYKSQEKELKKEAVKAEKADESRDKLRAEYQEKVAAGEIRTPTRRERLEKIASGHPDNPSVQAARRSLDDMDAASVEPSSPPATAAKPGDVHSADEIAKSGLVNRDELSSSQYKLKHIPIDSISHQTGWSPSGKSKTSGPIVVDVNPFSKDGSEILDGNHRVLEAKQRGDKTILAYVGNLSDENVPKLPTLPVSGSVQHGRDMQGLQREAATPSKALSKNPAADVGRNEAGLVRKVSGQVKPQGGEDIPESASRLEAVVAPAASSGPAGAKSDSFGDAFNDGRVDDAVKHLSKLSLPDAIKTAGDHGLPVFREKTKKSLLETVRRIAEHNTPDKRAARAKQEGIHSANTAAKESLDNARANRSKLLGAPIRGGEHLTNDQIHNPHSDANREAVAQAWSDHVATHLAKLDPTDPTAQGLIAAAKREGFGQPRTTKPAAKAMSTELPPNVQSSVDRWVGTLKDHAANMQKGRNSDKQFGGDGRYESDTHRNAKNIAETEGLIENFREMAKKNDVDADAVLKAAGMPDKASYQPSVKAAEWLTPKTAVAKAAEPSPVVDNPAPPKPLWQMSKSEFRDAVGRGKMKKATGKALPGEDKAKTSLKMGEINNYSHDDIAHFYATRNGHGASGLKPGYDAIEAGRQELLSDAKSEGRSLSPATAPAPSPAPFKPQGVAGAQMGLFGQTSSGQKQLFNVAKNDKQQAPRELEASMVEKITDALKKQSQENVSLEGQREMFSRQGDVDQYAKHKSTAGQGEFRWVTLEGGTHVQVNGSGEIQAGPKGLADKGIKKLSDFGGGKAAGKPTKEQSGHAKAVESATEFLKTADKSSQRGETEAMKHVIATSKEHGADPSEVWREVTWAATHRNIEDEVAAREEDAAGTLDRSRKQSDTLERSIEELHDAVGSVRKSGNKWNPGGTHPGMFDTKREAVAAAITQARATTSRNAGKKPGEWIPFDGDFRSIANESQLAKMFPPEEETLKAGPDTISTSAAIEKINAKNAPEGGWSDADIVPQNMRSATPKADAKTAKAKAAKAAKAESKPKVDAESKAKAEAATVESHGRGLFENYKSQGALTAKPEPLERMRQHFKGHRMNWDAAVAETHGRMTGEMKTAIQDAAEKQESIRDTLKAEQGKNGYSETARKLGTKFDQASQDVNNLISEYRDSDAFLRVAIEKSKRTIPPEVLADYPDLAPKAKASPQFAKGQFATPSKPEQDSIIWDANQRSDRMNHARQVLGDQRGNVTGASQKLVEAFGRHSDKDEAWKQFTKEVGKLSDLQREASKSDLARLYAAKPDLYSLIHSAVRQGVERYARSGRTEKPTLRKAKYAY